MLPQERKISVKILEELWYGNVVPNERELPPDRKQHELVGYIDRHEKELMPLLSEQAKPIFEKLRDCRSELFRLTERDAFVTGFELGMKIMMEVTEDIENDYK